MNQLSSIHLEIVNVHHYQGKILIENFPEIETKKEDITEQFHQFKNAFLMNLVNLKISFFTKLNHLKTIFLTLHQKNYTTENQEHNIITQLLDNIMFLKERLH